MRRLTRATAPQPRTDTRDHRAPKKQKPPVMIADGFDVSSLKPVKNLSPVTVACCVQDSSCDSALTAIASSAWYHGDILFSIAIMLAFGIHVRAQLALVAQGHIRGVIGFQQVGGELVFLDDMDVMHR